MTYLLVFILLPVLIFAQDHLLITEIFKPPSGEGSAAFVEIFNPTATPVSLNQIYLADHNTYYNMVNESYSSNATHFAVQFPNIELGPNEATEYWESSFIAADPGPGSFSENPGDGTGTATVSPDTLIASNEINMVIEITGASEYILTTLEIAVPDHWTWDGSITRSGSGLEQSSESINGHVITINNTVISDTEIGIVKLNNIKAPEETGSYVFEIKTATVGGQLTEIGTFPSIYVKEPIIIETITIEEARQLPVGSDVSVKGVVIIGVGKLSTTFTDVYIQDESGYGINIYRGGGLDQNLQRGNEVYIQGELTENNGVLEITNYTLTLATTGVILPAPVQICTDEARSIQYDSRFVMIQGELTGTYNASGGTNLYVDDGTGECTVRIWDTAEVFLKLPNKPFVPDKGEELDIEYCSGAENSRVTLRIFDLSGRLIITLFDGAGVPFTKTEKWNGRNDVEELVPLGTYICHLEVINVDNGKHTEKVAPIVVGTVLK